MPRPGARAVSHEGKRQLARHHGELICISRSQTLICRGSSLFRFASQCPVDSFTRAESNAHRQKRCQAIISPSAKWPALRRVSQSRRRATLSSSRQPLECTAQRVSRHHQPRQTSCQRVHGESCTLIATSAAKCRNVEGLRAVNRKSLPRARHSSDLRPSRATRRLRRLASLSRRVGHIR